jgi:hypothetical protein
VPSPPRIIDDLWRSREEPRRAPRVIRFVDDSLPEQAAFIRDSARRKLVFSTRRGGKSYGEGRFMLQEAWGTPNVSCLYVGLTRDSAWRTMWRDVLKDLDRKLGLGAKFNETKLLMTLPNGSTVQLLGLDATDDEKAKLLGGKYKVVVIDEAASFTIDLEDLVDNVVGPAVADLSGTIIMSGTPSNVHAGVFFGLTKDQNPMVPGRWSRDGWSCHRWSYEQNHYIRKQVENDIGLLVAAKPLIRNTPGFKMNWEGQWCIDDTLLVYKWQLGRNTFTGVLPTFRTGEWHYVLGIDTGWKASAFTLTAYHDHSPNLYVLESWKRRGMDITAMADVEKWYRSRFDIEQSIVDGANKQAVQEMNQRHGLSLVAAEKQDKFEFIDIMNDDFAQERIFVSSAKWEPEFVERFTDAGRCGTPEYVSEFKCGLLRAEYTTLVIDEDKLKKLRKREEQAGLENHCCDSTLYPWRKTYPYLSTVLPAATPAIGTPGWHEAEAKRQVEREEAELEEAIAEARERREANDELLDLIR